MSYDTRLRQIQIFAICHLLCLYFVACNDFGSGHCGVVVMAQIHRETEKEGSGGLQARTQYRSIIHKTTEKGSASGMGQNTNKG